MYNWTQNSLKNIFFYVCLFSFSTIYSQDSINVAHDFKMELEEGRSVMLSQYRGSVVYISIWASWCKPCIRNFKKYKDIRQKMSEMGVVLLNVSIDAKSEIWKRSIAKYDIDGIHAITNKEDLYPEYQISSIPYYEIIAKDGRIVYLSDDRDRDILAEFRVWLEE